jgi:hypothetical protein
LLAEAAFLNRRESLTLRVGPDKRNLLPSSRGGILTLGVRIEVLLRQARIGESLGLIENM